MKRLFLVSLAILVSTFCFGQRGGVMVVDSEKIFFSMTPYKDALADIERMSKDCQTQVDTKFKMVEILFEEYREVRSNLTAQQRAERERMILAKEKAATEYQERYFGKDGEVMKRRVELIAPIQTKVFGAIEAYAKELGYDVVLDRSANGSLLYMSDRVDHTQQIIERLK